MTMAMPIYEYHCSKCEKDHEIIQKHDDPPLAICPACGGSLKKQMSVSAFHLKGGGWYKEGYSSSKKDDSTSKPKPTEPAKTESKPATTPSKDVK
ncbi:MAG: zinc ribbon domain-containing protein [Deltaproteobacteria bacterium]|nr:zinc ribbon domain-containing protein [Deltaproteobacteria bacterium]